jgi:hypothetical protein
MPEPTFTRTSGQPLFLLPLTGMPDGYSITFLADVNPGGDSLTLTQSWRTNPGIYLFLGTVVSDQSIFVAEVRSFVGTRSTRFLWIANPAATAGEWVTNEIDLDGGDGVDPAAQIAFRNFILQIGGGSAVALNSTSDGFVFTAGGSAPIVFLTAFGSDGLPAGNSVTVPFSGAAAGTLGFTVSPAGDPALAQLDAGCRYFFDDLGAPVTGLLASVQYPVITIGTATLSLYAALDPIHPLLPSRSAMNFLQTPASNGSALVSGFRSVYGETMTLTPAVSTLFPAGPSLVFAVNASRNTPSAGDPYYMTFEGSFNLAVQNPSTGDTPIARMMCGFSGIEYAGLPAAQTNQLSFVSGQAAYAPVLRRTDIVVDSAPATNGVTLTTTATTSWAFLSTSGATAVDYFAQPHDSVLYQPTVGTEDFLSYLEVFAGTFPASPSTSQCVPMVPYALIDPAMADLATDLETQILSPTRRLLLAGILGTTETGGNSGSVPAATPQGIVVGLSQNLGYWKSVTFAQANDGTEKLQFTSVTGGFKAALQSNQLFAVVSNVDELLRCGTATPPFKLTVSGWRFDLSPAGWAAHGTIMIVKYAAGTIDELTADAGSWSWPAAADGYSDTSGNTATTQADVRRIIEEAKVASLARAEVLPFVNLISSPNWNGILFLRAPLSATSFPDQLRGLAAGIDPARLFAHHIGVTLAPVHNNAGTLQQDDAAIFGLIDYQDPVDLTDTGVDYDYKVLGLTVLFRNSAMASFSSQVELLINKLFGAITARRSVTPRGNNIVINGFYQESGGVPAYVFVMTETSVYALGGGTLDSIDITRAQFVTLSPTSSTDPAVKTRFVVDGRLRFKKVDDFDVFSFGPVTDPDGLVLSDGFLTLANLLIEMEFPVATPPEKLFRFNAGSLSFDLSQSIARPGSLFVHFPLALTGLIQASPKTKPGDYGFATIKTPTRQAAMTDPWYALTFDLTLGTLGALAGDLGLIVSLCAAWCGDLGDPLDFIGLKLPGSTGSRAAISLQGVVQLTFRSIEFFVNVSPQGVDYLLKFRGIALKVFTLSFPPGEVVLYVFGDPSGGSSGSIGWYAAYSKKEKGKKNSSMQFLSSHTLAAPPTRELLPTGVKEIE